MDVVSEVAICLRMVQKLKHRPLVDKLLQCCAETLENDLEEPELPPLPASPVPELEPETGTKYTRFISGIMRHLHGLCPKRPQKHNLTEAARLWQLHKDLNDLDLIISAAHAQAVREASVNYPVDKLPGESSDACNGNCNADCHGYEDLKD
jgi:hypothetical protein